MTLPVCTIILFGATGDLAKKKLLPALADMQQRGQLHRKTRVIAIGRREYTTVQYLKEEGVRFQERCLVRLPRRDSYQRAGYEIVTDGTVDFAKTTAVMTLNDQVALGTFRGCFEKDIRIPEDLSLVGGEDLPEAEFFPVPLTTVRFPVDEVAKTAVTLLLERSKGRKGNPERVRVPPVLVIRKSCRKQ